MITIIAGFKWLVDNNNKRAGLGSHSGMGLKMDVNLENGCKKDLFKLNKKDYF